MSGHVLMTEVRATCDGCAFFVLCRCLCLSADCASISCTAVGTVYGVACKALPRAGWLETLSLMLEPACVARFLGPCVYPVFT